MTDNKSQPKPLAHGQTLEEKHEYLRCDVCGCMCSEGVSVTYVRLRDGTKVTRCSNHHTPETAQGSAMASGPSTESDDVPDLCERVRELEEWKESAMRLLPLQEWGQVLNVKLGDSIHDKVLPALQRLAAAEARAEGLEKALRDVINERDTELDMMRCQFRQGTPENNAWHEGVYAAWARFEIVKKRAAAALSPVAAETKEKE